MYEIVSDVSLIPKMARVFQVFFVSMKQLGELFYNLEKQSCDG